MFTRNLDHRNALATDRFMHANGTGMVAMMRVFLAIAALATISIHPAGLGRVGSATWIIAYGYVLYSGVLYTFSQPGRHFSQSKLIHWLDLAWYALIIFFTGGVNSIFFIFYFFAILTASFRWGFEEGARITVASAVLFAACGLVSERGHDLPRLLLRSSILLTFGYMSARWGESKVVLTRRLALLRDVSRISNPRFGVDHTITTVLQKILQFFGASSCTLVLHDKASASHSLRTIQAGQQTQAIVADRIGAKAAAPLMSLSPTHVVAYSRSRYPALANLFSNAPAPDGAEDDGFKSDRAQGEILATLFDARAFISAPISLREWDGHLYVASREGRYSQADALFLSHVVEQVFPVIENIALLDRMATEAALKERKKIALDLHDAAIQPYIGLKMGLDALRNKAAPGNPLVEDLDNLLSMATQVIVDLRRYAGGFKVQPQQSESIFMAALRQEAVQAKQFYGIDITVDMSGALNVSDRLTAEVLQIVREGLSNIYKHTSAQRGAIRIECVQGFLLVEIENENKTAGTTSLDFTPRSITERTAALGGTTQVRQQPGAATTIHIEIPV